MMFCQASLMVSEPSQVGEVRRMANRLATGIGLAEPRCGASSIIATELATNLSRYARQGEVLMRSYCIGGISGVELLAIDRGPGMENIAKCVEDGYSTGGTAGNGLGAVRRLATTFDIYSNPPQGTVVLARVEKNATSEFRTNFEWGVVNLPAPRETFCGDTWRIAERGGELSVMVADGLGHGPKAAEAADIAGTLFDSDGFSSPTEFLTVADRRLRGTRGAAVAMARVNVQSGELNFAGVGNIAGSLRSRVTAEGRGLVSHNGTVGAEMRKVQPFVYECPDEPLLVMHSDGLQSRWSFTSYPGLMNRHPAIVASILYRDFNRGHDDLTVCVIRLPSAKSIS